ncbi:hypothetical protein [Rhizobium sp. C4]|uniref:hypothetical protein n=1 Tax=Rhizobium sp. C4 TaxID=1349800 RepID=UPI001E41111F|nr:hypothetical protein [Rhizobium sp. C4]MCD2172853.1 hypothetical protein [Rhizobium sp. C4]
MILEALHFTAALATSSRRKPGEIAGSVGLWSRARRCRKAWGPHEENCQAFVEEKVGQLVDRRSVAVLGSGLLHEVPLEFLAKSFQKVTLYDLVHLPSARMKVRRLGRDNVRLVERDLSGGLGFLMDDGAPDLVVSACLLSQMALNAPEPAAVVRGHLADLLGGPWMPCLITDTAYEIRNRKGEVVATRDLLGGEPPPPAFRAWDWTVAPYGEAARETETVHRVIAV